MLRRPRGLLNEGSPTRNMKDKTIAQRMYKKLTLLEDPVMVYEKPRGEEPHPDDKIIAMEGKAILDGEELTLAWIRHEYIIEGVNNTYVTAKKEVPEPIEPLSYLFWASHKIEVDFPINEEMDLTEMTEVAKEVIDTERAQNR